ncbi:MAG: mechanosensitive ion channel family protein, partial [Planctomycetota bacterium]|nr:mechanosensitive ion channel family protein [Planctomycetota bacterium]
ALVLAAGLYLRRRARARVEALLTSVDPERRIILDPIDRWTFYGAYLLRGGLPWAALAVVPWAVAVPLELPAAGAARVSGALTALLGVQVVGLFNHLLLRDRLVRAVLPLSEENKRPLHRRIQLALAAFGPLLVAWLLARGVPELWATATVLRASLSVLLVLALIATLHVARHDVGDHLRFEVTPPEPGGRLPVFDLLKTLYNRVVDELLTLVLLDLLVIGTLWVGGYVEQAAFLLRATVQTALTLGAALLLVALARKANRRVMSGSLANETTRPGVQITLSMLAFVGSRLAEVLILAAVGVSLFDAWGGDVEPVLAFLRSDRFVDGVAAVLKVLFACAAAFYANRLANFTVDAFVEQTLRTASPDVARRRDTFAPLAKSAIRYVLIMAALVYSATQAGLDIVSILAGLGVLGLAIAFGAQTLVKDVISGVFVIIDDELAVGDWVRIRDVEGTVEHVGVRTTKVRTVTGVLISVPNGSIDQVHNFNRGWNRAIVEVNVTYDAPVEKAMAVLKEVAEEYRRQRPDLLIEAPEVQGITQYGTSGITLRVRAKTAPLALWQVERELRLRALVAFEDQGIEIPISRHVVFLKADGGDGRGLQPADVVRQLAAA